MKKYMALLMIAVTLLAGCKEDDQTAPRTFLIPKGYTGWVKIEYTGQKNVSASEKKVPVLKADSNGLIRTEESLIHEGWADSDYYYVDDNGSKTKLNPDKMIHGNSSGRESDKRTEQYFFVGTDDQFRKNQYKPEHQ
ncbi:hypothetical protein GKZ89_06905 [Bacillus mangrovi]|uniref:DUF6843 domain-containing protein n=1 Tax=Metabacillus mangrovi TaxID=1491830 RepID=A0A7X2S4L0_9BACI|nr:hypothetical protein [Metabacillus mangrovi]MTH53138.1 hypothetical protein [Metabacillus mangrovi]